MPIRHSALDSPGTGPDDVGCRVPLLTQMRHERCACASSGSQGAERADDGSVIGHEGESRTGDDKAEGRLADRARVDVVDHLPQRRYGRRDPATSELLAGSAPTAIARMLGKSWGFSEKVRQAPVFYALVAVGTIGDTALSLLGVNPMTLLVVVAVINGIADTPFLVVVMLIASDRSIMGEHRNGRLATALGWGTAALMALCAVALVATTAIS